VHDVLLFDFLFFLVGLATTLFSSSPGLMMTAMSPQLMGFCVRGFI